MLLSLACSALGEADPQYGYGSHGILGHHYGYGGAMVGYGGIPYTVQASDEGTPASAVRLAATLPYTGYGHTLPYGYAGYGQFPGYAHPGYAHPGYAYPGYAYPGLGYAAAVAPTKEEWGYAMLYKYKCFFYSIIEIYSLAKITFLHSFFFIQRRKAIRSHIAKLSQ